MINYRMEEQEEDIFEDLLKGDWQASTPSRHDQKSSAPSSDGFYEWIQPGMSQDTESYADPSIASILKAKGSTLLAHCRDNKFCYVLINKSSEVSIQVYQLNHHSNKSDRSAQKSKLCHSFKTGLSSSHFQDEKRHGQKKHSMYIVHPKLPHTHSPEESPKTELTAATTCSGNIILPPPLFVYLFGQDAACLQSSILMLCCNNGNVFSYTFQSAMYGKLQLFCSVKRSVVALMPVMLTQEEPENGQQKNDNDLLGSLQEALKPRLSSTAMQVAENSLAGLLVVGDSGESYLFIGPPGPAISIPVMFLLHDAITTCVAVSTHVIYSTGTCVKTFQLALCKREKQFSVTQRRQQILAHAKIRDLQLQTDEEENVRRLVGITNDYDMITIAVLKSSSSQSACEGIKFCEYSQPQDGKESQGSLKETLHRLNLHTEGIKALQEQSLGLDSKILQLNLFAALLQQQKLSSLQRVSNFGQEKQGADKCSTIIQCDCVLVHPEIESSPSWKLRIKLCNKSSVSLSNAWSVLVAEKPILSYESNCVPHTNSFQFQLVDGLQANSDVVFIVPVANSLVSNCLLELQVSISLVLWLASPDMERQPQRSSQNTPHHLMQVEIHNQCFDILCFLQTSSSVQDGQNCHSYSKAEGGNWLTEQLQKMAANRVGGYPKLRDGSNFKEEAFSVSVDLPPSFVDNKNINKSSDVLAAVLGSQRCKNDELSCCLIGPNMPTLHLAVVANDSKDTTPKPSGNFSRFCLRLKSDDVLQIFSVFEALLRKVRANEPAIQSVKLQGESLKRRTGLENYSHDLKFVRNRMADVFDHLKFCSEPNQDYQVLFCQFLECVKSVNLPATTRL